MASSIELLVISSECDCDRTGTQECNHNTGECICFPGVEGRRCDTCMRDHWGIETNGLPVSYYST